MATTDFIAAIELSSSKLSGIVGQKNSDGSLQVLAYATEEAAPFIRKGAIYNIDKTAQALTAVIGRLEGQLNRTIAKVYAGIGGQSLRGVPNAISRTLDVEGIISQELVDSIYDENRSIPLAEMCVLDVAPQEFCIDNTLHADPVGVAGRSVTGQFLNIVARASLKKNLEYSFEQAKLEIADDLIVAPIAMARAVLSEAEMRSGCALVDFGADTTTVMVFKNNLLRHLCVIPLGGNNITRDITSLKMETSEAERLKLQYGDALYEEAENGEPAVCTTADGHVIELSKLNDIVGARADEIVRNVWEQLKISGYAGELLSGIVLTGGGSNLKNLEEALRRISKEEKIKTASYVQLPVYGYNDALPKNGTQNTLIGLLNWGHENCCKPEAPKVVAQPQPVAEPENIFKDDAAWQQQEEEIQRQKAQREKEDRERKIKEAKEKERADKEAKKRAKKAESGPSLWEKIMKKAENATSEFFGDKSDELED